jgi:hypothetical protein
MARWLNFRIDTSTVRDKISQARSWVFERGYSIAGKAIKDLLDAISLTPTQVRLYIWINSFKKPDLSTERFLNPPILLTVQL